MKRKLYLATLLFFLIPSAAVYSQVADICQVILQHLTSLSDQFGAGVRDALTSHKMHQGVACGCR